jgi:hypothetical protein
MSDFPTLRELAEARKPRVRAYKVGDLVQDSEGKFPEMYRVTEVGDGTMRGVADDGREYSLAAEDLVPAKPRAVDPSLFNGTKGRYAEIVKAYREASIYGAAKYDGWLYDVTPDGSVADVYLIVGLDPKSRRVTGDVWYDRQKDFEGDMTVDQIIKNLRSRDPALARHLFHVGAR